MTEPARPPCHRQDRPSCLRDLAAGWITVGDLCAACTRQFMDALDPLLDGQTWHRGYLDRAAGIGRQPR